MMTRIQCKKTQNIIKAKNASILLVQSNPSVLNSPHARLFWIKSLMPWFLCSLQPEAPNMRHTGTCVNKLTRSLVPAAGTTLALQVILQTGELSSVPPEASARASEGVCTHSRERRSPSQELQATVYSEATNMASVMFLKTTCQGFRTLGLLHTSSMEAINSFIM